MEEKVIFSLEHFSLFYKEKQVLKDISMKIYEHKITAFIGPSGCGKSSLLRCFNRMNDFIDGTRYSLRRGRKERCHS